MFGTSKPIIMLNVYIHPSESDYYKITSNGYGIEQLEECITDFDKRYDQYYLLMSGDFNARVGQRNAQSILYDFNFWDPLVSNYDEGNVSLPEYERVSCDQIENAFGRQLIELCELYDCIILNGLTQHNFDGDFTFISNSGASVVDYFIVSKRFIL